MKKHLELNVRRFFLILLAEVASIILHNVIYGLSGTEEGFFFILATIAIPIYFVVSVSYTMILMHKKKRLRKDWWLGFLGFWGFQGLNGLMNGDWWTAMWILWFIWFIYFFPVRKK